MPKPIRAGLRAILIDFVLQDPSLIHHIFLKLPIYSKTELIIKFFTFFLSILTLWSVFRPANIVGVITITLVGHLINWFFNCHRYQILYEVLGLEYSASKAINYVLKLKKEAEKKGLHVMIYGSWSRGKASKSSDLDIFIVNVRGSLLDGLRMGFTSLKYRLIALLTLVPADIYVVDRVDYLGWRSKARPDEKPIILSDPTGTMRRIYGREKELKEFLREIERIYKK
jgi:predicted nucleotidyltransferase